MDNLDKAIAGLQQTEAFLMIDRLSASSAIIPLCDIDLMINCNESIHDACEFILKSFNNTESKDLFPELVINKGNALIEKVTSMLLIPYYQDFQEWNEVNIAKDERDNPDFYNDEDCFKKIEKKYEHYDKMVLAFKECRPLFTEFIDKVLQPYISSLSNNPESTQLDTPSLLDNPESTQLDIPSLSNNPENNI